MQGAQTPVCFTQKKEKTQPWDTLRGHALTVDLIRERVFCCCLNRPTRSFQSLMDSAVAAAVTRPGLCTELGSARLVKEGKPEQRSRDSTCAAAGLRQRAAGLHPTH